MKLNELLEETKIGKDNYKKIKSIEHIHNTPEENKISFLLQHSLNSLKESKEITGSLQLAYSQIKGYEERKRRVTKLHESFLRMKYDALKNTYLELIENINKKEELQNEELLSNAVALVHYAFNEISEQCDKKVTLPEIQIQEKVNEEYKLIKENI